MVKTKKKSKPFSGILSFITLLLLFLVSFPLSLKAAPRVQKTDQPVVIVIDPGHGGENEGTTENGFLEKSMNMITAKAMYDELCLYENVEVYLTHTEDMDLSLKARAEYAASVNADFLFSIHYNASVEHELFGTEVWISSQVPYNAYGYQFGYEQMLTMQDMGLFLRGIKTRLNERGTDYYGIIRESVALSVPAVIIEHCHVDENRDVPYCDSEEDLIAFGKADAGAVARYFGLRSDTLGVDYSKEPDRLPDVKESSKVQSSLKDESPPDVCMVTLLSTNDEECSITLQVTATDYDSPLIYYDYSMDSGLTYSPLQPWPGSDALTGSYQDTFTLNLAIDPGIQPNIIVRAYNLFDACTASEKLPILHIFRQKTEDSQQVEPTDAENIPQKENPNLPGTTTFFPVSSTLQETETDEIEYWDFLKICILEVIVIFVLILISQIISHQKRKKKISTHKGRGRNPEP